MIQRILYIITIFAAISCTPTGTQPEDYSDFERIPLKSKIENVQPMTGIVLWTTNGRSATFKDKIQLEFAYMLYNDVCKGKDQFDWTPMDRLLEQVASRGHQLVVRFRYTYVGQQCSVPDYIKAWPGYEETVAKSEGKLDNDIYNS